MIREVRRFGRSRCSPPAAPRPRKSHLARILVVFMVWDGSGSFQMPSRSTSAVDQRCCNRRAEDKLSRPPRPQVNFNRTSTAVTDQIAKSCETGDAHDLMPAAGISARHRTQSRAQRWPCTSWEPSGCSRQSTKIGMKTDLPNSPSCFPTPPRLIVHGTNGCEKFLRFFRAVARTVGARDESIVRSDKTGLGGESRPLESVALPQWGVFSKWLCRKPFGRAAKRD
jgi:hypothetical protein